MTAPRGGRGGTLVKSQQPASDGQEITLDAPDGEVRGDELRDLRRRKRVPRLAHACEHGLEDQRMCTE